MKIPEKKWIIGGIGILIILLISGFSAYKLGYRLTSNFTLGKIGYLSMTVPLPDTSVFIDQSKKIVTTKDNEVVKIPFSPGEHSVIVSREGYFPWTKNFTIPSGEVVTLSPFFISQNISGMLINKQDPEYLQIKNDIIRSKLPTQDKPIISTDKLVSLWVEDNAIMVKKDGAIQKVIQSDTIVRNVAFYKDRSDTVLFSTTNSVYVIEIDKNGVQNVMPIYRGQTPLFIKADSNSVYVLDGEILMQVVI